MHDHGLSARMSTWSAVGVVNTNRNICSDSGPCRRFEAKLTVRSYLQFALMPKSRDLGIFVPRTNQLLYRMRAG